MYIGSIVAGRVVQYYESTVNNTAVHQWWEIWMVPAALATFCFIVFLIFFREKEVA